MEQIIEDNLDINIKQLSEELRKEIPSFHEIGHKFINKEITSAEFKASSGGMGVYAERSGNEFMIRLRVLSGVMDYATLKFVYDLVKEYSLDFIHLTTRQTIQLHHLQLDDMIEIMEKSLDHNIITRGGGGNYPRNVSLSPLSGVETGEAFDVTPYAILANKYFVSRINKFHLPRKFKVAFSNNGQDSANASIADLGFLAINKDNREYFQVYLGGSMGPNEAIAVPYDELISPQDILYHIEASLSLFQEEGDYQNKGKARMRYIVKRMGKEAFLDCYKDHLKKAKELHKLEFILNPSYDNDIFTVNTEVADDKSILEFTDVIPQKQTNRYSVVIHPQGGILSAKDFGVILQFIERSKGSAQVRLSMEESMFIRNLTSQQAKELLELTKEVRQLTKLGKSICCIGTPICQIGIQSSQTLLADILSYFDQKGFTDDILPSISISGCTNSCARHQVSEIGFQGKKKRVNSVLEDAFTLLIDGNVNIEDTHLGKGYGDILARDIPEMLYQLAIRLQEQQIEFKEYIALYEEEFNSLIEKYRI